MITFNALLLVTGISLYSNGASAFPIIATSNEQRCTSLRMSYNNNYYGRGGGYNDYRDNDYRDNDYRDNDYREGSIRNAIGSVGTNLNRRFGFGSNNSFGRGGGGNYGYDNGYNSNGYYPEYDFYDYSDYQEGDIRNALGRVGRNLNQRFGFGSSDGPSFGRRNGRYNGPYNDSYGYDDRFYDDEPMFGNGRYSDRGPGASENFRRGPARSRTGYNGDIYAGSDYFNIYYGGRSGNYRSKDFRGDNTSFGGRRNGSDRDYGRTREGRPAALAQYERRQGGYGGRYDDRRGNGRRGPTNEFRRGSEFDRGMGNSQFDPYYDRPYNGGGRGRGRDDYYSGNDRRYDDYGRGRRDRY